MKKILTNFFAGNDIIVLAKHMCMIMMEMTDFTRGKGPLQTTMAVIEAAKKISEAGTKLGMISHTAIGVRKTLVLHKQIKNHPTLAYKNSVRKYHQVFLFLRNIQLFNNLTLISQT